MMDLSKSHKNLKGYSLLEITISLAIVGIATVVMLNFLILSFKITAINLGRSVVREELSYVINLMAKDFRNADIPPVCITTPGNSSCTIAVNGVSYIWSACEFTKLCKYRSDGAGNLTAVYTTPNTVKVVYFQFDNGFALQSLSGVSNFVVTISAGHSNESLGINNIIKQSSFSIRNYVL